VVDVVKGLDVAQRVEEESIVLLKNDHAILPIDPSQVHSIAIVGGHADVGMISGGGSAQVDPPGGNAIMPPGKGGTVWQEHIWFPTSPLKALRAKLPNTKIDFDPGTDPQSAAKLARKSDLAIVFAYQWESEDMDLPSLSLSADQNALIEQTVAANPHTIVVLESGTAVTMPWIDKVAGVVEAWYAGSSGHKALAEVLVGDVDPSGKLPITFPKSDNDLPRPVIPDPPVEDRGQATGDSATHTSAYAIHYDEGSGVGYKWFEAQRKQPLFPFGFGLSYTSYAYSGLNINSTTKMVRFTVTNTGKRVGTEITEVYARLPQGTNESSYKRLVGWKRVTLAPGESQTVTVPIDSRVLRTFDETKSSWNFAPGEYGVFVGPSSDNTPMMGNLRVH
jgi:beta-glucosidase